MAAEADVAHILRLFDGGHAVEDVFLQYAVTRIGVHRMITRTDPMINRPHDLGKKH